MLYAYREMMTGIKVILVDKFDSHIRRQLIFTLGLNPNDASLLKFRKPSRESRENQSHVGTAAINDYESKGRKFESCRAHSNCFILLLLARLNP